MSQKKYNKDITEFYLNLDEHDRYSVDSSFYQALIFLDLDEVHLYNIINRLDDKDTYKVCHFCSSLTIQNQKRAIKLYDYVKNQKDNSINGYIFSSILSALYPSMPNDTFSLAKELLETNERAAFVAFSQFEYIDSSHIEGVFKIASVANLALNDIPKQITTLLANLIKNELTNKEIRKHSFSRLNDLFKIEDDELKDYIFSRCRFIRGNEAERYKLLLNTFLVHGEGYIKRISDYFGNFLNPDYFFHLLVFLHQINYEKKNKMELRIFKRAFSHFWKVNEDRTKELMLELISHDISILRFAAVDLLRRENIDEDCFLIDLLKLDSQQKQLRASEALMFTSYYKIEQILPLILLLKESSYSLVTEYIKNKLSDLILYSYNEHLWDALQQATNDKIFLKTMQKSIEKYRSIKKRKSLINDLNPYSNERDWVQLYVKLHLKVYR